MREFMLKFADVPEIALGVIETTEAGNVIVSTPLAVAQVGVVENGPDKFRIDKKMLEQMAANATKWFAEGGPPLPGYIGHATSLEERQDRAAGKIQPGLLLRKVWMADMTMMGEVEFMPWTWAQVNEGGSKPLRGLSIVFNETAKDRKGKEIGAMLRGVDVVPEPFLPVQIAAAKAGDESLIFCTSRFELSGGEIGPREEPMDEQTKKLLEQIQTRAESAERKLAELQKKHDATALELSKLKETHTAELEKVTKASETIKSELASKAIAEENRSAVEAIEVALGKGVVTKAEVEGYDKKEPDAAIKAMKTLGYFQDAGALLRYCAKQPDETSRRVTMGKRVSTSGETKPKGEPKAADVAARRTELAAKFRVTDEDEVDSLVGQDRFLARIDEVLEASKGALNYGQASIEASRKYPEEYAEYTEAMGQ